MNVGEEQSVLMLPYSPLSAHIAGGDAYTEAGYTNSAEAWQDMVLYVWHRGGNDSIWIYVRWMQRVHELKECKSYFPRKKKRWLSTDQSHLKKEENKEQNIQIQYNNEV